MSTHDTSAALNTRHGDDSEHIRWSAIFGGAVAALGLWILLYALGLALGLSTMEPDDPGSAKSSGLFTGIWGLVSPLLALFAGGYIAGHGAGEITKQGGAIHGLIMWGTTTLVGAFVLANLLSSVLGGVATAGKAVVSAGASAVSGAASGAANNSGEVAGVARSLGIDVEDALRPINQRLSSEGKPTVTAQQLESSVRAVVQDGLRTGRVDRSLLVSSIAGNTSLTQQDASELAGKMEAQISAAKSQIGEKAKEAGQAVQTGALKAADATGKAFWGVFGALLLGMVAAVIGASMAVSRAVSRPERVATARGMSPSRA